MSTAQPDPSCGDGACYRRSSRCSDSACVEVETETPMVRIRNSADPDTVLEIPREQWRHLTAAIQAGEFAV